ncbi:hypothetical protein QQF64_012385 [Cirrhinus molitorella]|uniref:Uncharacterized protein n=1 Tax=Cirrhinus molitorella TaxID=172907 RepID=A0ABR3LX33_9TELE
MSNGVLLSCRGWHEDEGARLEGAENQALRVHGSPCLSQQGTVVTSSSLSLSLSVCVIAEGSEQLRSVLVVSEGIVCRLCLPV